jgi:hypothetical integral membrane protein (TIGR02206 family)
MPAPFVLFGRDHLIVLALAFAAPLALAAVTRRGERLQRFVRFGLAAMLIGNWIFWYLLFWRRGWLTWGDALPLNLCDWTNAAVIWALLRKNQAAYALGYFWALAGTLQGLITPDTPYDFPEIRFVIFSIFHAGIIAAVLYLTFGARMRPYASGLPRVVLWSLVYAAAAGLADWQLGVNYGFLRAKPAGATIFDYLAPWPWYVAELPLLGIASLLIWYAPWFVADRISGAQSSRERP